MEDQFVPHELVIKLIELGFDEPCLMCYRKMKQHEISKHLRGAGETVNIGSPIKLTGQYKHLAHSEYLYDAPLWQQAFDWFREKYKLFNVIHVHKEGYSYNIHSLNKRGTEETFIFSTILTSITSNEYIKTYKEARQACLEKLIELVTDRK